MKKKFVRYKCEHCGKEFIGSVETELCDRQCPKCNQWTPEVEILEIFEGEK